MELLRPAVLLCPPLGTGPAEVAELDWRAAARAALAAAGLTVLAPGLAPVATDPLAAPGPASPMPPAPREDDPRLALAGWVADQAVAVSLASLREPLLLVARGTSGRGLPALGFSQRAARHAVIGYVLIDANPPPPSRSGQDWPDAPVVALRSADAARPAVPSSSSQAPRSPADQFSREAQLRGWPVLVGDPVQTLVSLALAWPDLPLA
jgi:hypothetical protein